MNRKNYFTKSIVLLFVTSILLLACSNEALLDSQKTDPESIFKTSSKKSSETRLHFTTNLKGDQEVPANDSKATGQAIVTISKDESTIHYKLIIAHIENVRAAHFHKAPKGSNGGVVVGLFLGPKIVGSFNGILTEGYVTAESIGENGENKLASLIQDIRDGNIYINVHTDKYPGGELRGQL